MHLQLIALEQHFLTMCTLFIAIDVHPDYPLIVAGNRDEFYQRETAPLQDWGEIVGGRDLQQGGHWLAVDKLGRWAALTNHRDPENTVEAPHTRGDLVKDYLRQSLSIEGYVDSIQSSHRSYEGFNLLMGDEQGRVAHYSNMTAELSYLSAGVHGLSNALLNTPWPKVVEGKAAFERLLKNNDAVYPSAVFNLLANRQQAPKHQLPSTGLPIHMERLLSSLFIRSPIYGTRSSALLTCLSNKQLQFFEQSYSLLGRKGEVETVTFQIP